MPAAVAPSTPASEWDFCSIARLSEALRARTISASELLAHTIARIEALDQRFNAVVVRDFDRAREAARAADIALGCGDVRPLLGIPVTLKEPFDVVGLPSTWGFPQFREFTPKDDALVVTRLKQAGAVVVGKTNIPIGLRDFQSYNDIYGTTNNPWGYRPLSRRLFGRVRSGAGGGFRASVNRIGYWWLDPGACAFLRGLRPQADARPGSASRI